MNELCHLWRSERYGACGDDVSDGVLFTGEKYPKAAVSPDPFYGVPAEAQQSGFGGERTSSGVNEACRLRQAERYAACEDEVRRRWGSMTHRT